MPLTLTASASSSLSPYYSPDKAIDNSDSTYWIGARNSSPWWLTLDTGRVYYITTLNMKWQHPYYIPQNYDIQTSYDGVIWENVCSGIAGVLGPQGDTKEVSKQARYIRLYIRSVEKNFPILKEIEVYGRETISRLMRFQAGLNDASGMPTEGAFNLTFRLYDTETAGTAIWQESQDNIAIEEGLLNVELGSVTPLNIDFDKQYWLSVQTGFDPEMTPRFKLTGAPYSFSLQ